MKIPDTESTQGIGRNMYYLMWALLLGLLAWLFHGLLEKQQNPNHNLTEISQQDGVREVVLERNRFGHYVASGTINGFPVVFMLDTGATDIAIPARLASSLKVNRGTPVTMQTANGNSIGYLTRLDSVALGPIELQGVQASINPGMNTDEVLLGMSFLKQVDFSQEGDTLHLRWHPRI